MMLEHEFEAAVIEAARSAGMAQPIGLFTDFGYPLRKFGLAARWPDGRCRGIRIEIIGQKLTEDLARTIGHDAAAHLMRWHETKTASAA